MALNKKNDNRDNKDTPSLANYKMQQQGVVFIVSIVVII